MEIREKLEEEKEFFKMKMTVKELRELHGDFIDFIKPSYDSFGFKFNKKETVFFKDKLMRVWLGISHNQFNCTVIKPSMSVSLFYGSKIFDVLNYDCFPRFSIVLNHLPARYLKNTDYDMVFENDYGKSYDFTYFLSNDTLMTYVDLHNKYFHDVTVPLYNSFDNEEGVYKYLRYIINKELDMYNQPVITGMGHLGMDITLQFIAMGFDLGMDGHKELIEQYLDFLNKHYGEKGKSEKRINYITRFFNYFISK